MRDGEGYFQIVGRESSDILKVGGFKIGAREIEEVLEQYEGIREAAVIGLEDQEWGQRIEAYVVTLKDQTLDKMALEAPFLKSALRAIKSRALFMFFLSCRATL